MTGMFFLGIFIGVFLGWFILGLCVAGREDQS